MGAEDDKDCLVHLRVIKGYFMASGELALSIGQCRKENEGAIMRYNFKNQGSQSDPLIFK